MSMKSTAAILAAAMFIGERTTASASLAGAAAVVWPTLGSRTVAEEQNRREFKFRLL